MPLLHFSGFQAGTSLDWDGDKVYLSIVPIKTLVCVGKERKCFI